MYISGIIHIAMATDELDRDNAPETEPNSAEADGRLPKGIARIREEWHRAGLSERGEPDQTQQNVEPVVLTVSEQHLTEIPHQYGCQNTRVVVL